MTDNLAACKTCGVMAVWELAPSDSFGEYCDDCVPRGCSCNAIEYPLVEGGEQERDERGRLLPCCEYDYFPNGFPPGDPDGPRKYRDAILKAQSPEPNKDSPSNREDR